MCSSDMRPAKKSMWRDFSLGKESSLLLNLMMMVKPKKKTWKYCLFLSLMNTKNTICIEGKCSPGSFRLRRATWMEKFPTWQNCGNKDIMRCSSFKQRTAVFNVCKLPLLSRTRIANLPRKRKVLNSPAVARNLWTCHKKMDSDGGLLG